MKRQTGLKLKWRHTLNVHPAIIDLARSRKFRHMTLLTGQPYPYIVT
jgi:hypothetical protein